jgi:hypothetical protein
MTGRVIRPGAGPSARRTRGARRRAPFARASGLIVVGLLVSGCSMAVRAARMYYDATPIGTEQREWGLRRTMASGAFDIALVHVSSRDEAAPRDKLLRSLYHGIVSYYAGDYERSGQALRAADEMAEDRYTKSLSRGALSLVSNDLVLPYMPGHTERLLVHYYAALGYLKRDSVAGAAVEVRRLSQLLEEFDEHRDPADRSTRAFLRYFAGTVFEAAGESNDASVAYRNAAELTPSQGIPRSRRPPPGSGEVIVLLERGFVAQRVEENLHIEVAESERDSLAQRKEITIDSSDGWAITRMLRQLDSGPDGGVYRTSGERHLQRDHFDGDDANELLLKVAWPVFLRPLRESAPATVLAPDDSVVPFMLAGDISDGIIADYRRQRVVLLTRTVARAAVKFAAAEAAEKKKGKGGKMVATIAGAILEHADTRSWHLLPADVAIARLTLPAGRHRLSLRTGAASDSARMIDLGEVEVIAGRLAFVSTRIWPKLSADGHLSDEPARGAVPAVTAQRE